MLRNITLSLLTFTLMIGIASAESTKPGLLILSHGSPSPAWKTAIENLAKKVEAANADKKVFHAVTGANMEFTQPDAATGIEVLEAAGCDRIIVVPVFVAPTSHTHFDVPAVLGIYSSPSIRETLKEENARIAAPKVPITVTQTMSEGEILDWYVEDEVKSLVKNPKDEALILVSHGDADHRPMIDAIMQRLFTRACGSAGITSGKFVYCGVGQTYNQDVIPVIQHFGKEKKRVIVVGCYLATSAKSLSNLAGRMGGAPSGHGHGGAEQANPLEGIDVLYSEGTVIDHPNMPQWVLDTAEAAL
jgi:sirohydrochlorin cobaltochelatase